MNDQFIHLLGIYIGNCPVADCRKYFAENFSRSVMLVVTMVVIPTPPLWGPFEGRCLSTVPMVVFQLSKQQNRTRTTVFGTFQIVSVATPAEPRGENKHFFFVQILGGEKLLKFVEKCRWNISKRPERGYIFFSNAFWILFRIFFLRFSNSFSYQFKSFSGAVSFCRHAALTNRTQTKSFRSKELEVFALLAGFPKHPLQTSSLGAPTLAAATHVLLFSQGTFSSRTSLRSSSVNFFLAIPRGGLRSAWPPFLEIGLFRPI